ncbi:hypothetical protein ANANG_G00290760 [Anguilla anguilla]|uniref:Uncharacterized protein n=1 Tax=Anguilla anguilla TaxID=7936 RepID=A0A9D3LL09_ANGAN|nr:hypothetical protein ANANG_G00290760 [Anguilla anguilla]
MNIWDPQSTRKGVCQNVRNRRRSSTDQSLAPDQTESRGHADFLEWFCFGAELQERIF